MKSQKSSKYSSKEDVDELEQLNDKLAQDLRKHIRLLGHFPILSQGWLDMAETLGRIASVSDVESKLSAGKGDKTLWETEDQALRFLLEDGKLNLCLRNLVEYKEIQKISNSEDRASYRGPPLHEHVSECDKFEKGLGVVLKNAWNYVEAVQTTDCIALVTYIANIVQFSIDLPSVIESFCKAGDIHQRQEILIYYYLHALLKNIGNIREER